MNRKLVAVTLVALVWSSLAFCGEIHDAAQNGDLAKVKALLKANPDLVSSKDTNGMTPLHCAAVKGHKDVAELLLANKAEVNARDNVRLDAFALCGVSRATRTWRNCCWPTRPRSMPRTNMARRLCTWQR